MSQQNFAAEARRSRLRPIQRGLLLIVDARRPLTQAVLTIALVLSGFAFARLVVHAQTNDAQTRLLRMPTVSATQIAFAYANNIWTVPRAGGSARRLTSFHGQTVNPHFSPDGKWIAFSGEYAGNLDAYVVASEGGEPRRLTWHPERRPGPGLDARRQVSAFLVSARYLGAGRHASFLDRACGRWRRRSDADPARVPGQDFSRRRARRLSHEQFLGRGTSQLSRRSKSAGLDCRSQNLRSGFAAMDRLKRRRSGLDR